jgi:hypothetical protein
MVQKAQDLSEKITFTKVNSCESMEKVMNDFLETYKKLNPKRSEHWYDAPITLYTNGARDFAVEDVAVAETSNMNYKSNSAIK